MIRRPVIHTMGRRCRNWDYCCDAVYMITLTLADRKRPLLGRLEIAPGQEPTASALLPGQEWPGATLAAEVAPARFRAAIVPSPMGQVVESLWRRMGEFTPEIKPLALQLMPEHLHGILWVRRYMRKPVGMAIRGFKAGASKAAAEMGAIAAGSSLFAPGFVDNILFDKPAYDRALAYLADNPRRLAIKRLMPELFKVLRDIYVPWRGVSGGGHFAAIGNHFLLQRPCLLQIQCSRIDFAYRRERDARGKLTLVRGADGCKIVEKTTPAFEEQCAELLAAAAHGAVLVSPCISDGEREIAARAFAAGHAVITLSNKGFSPLYKPGGRLFEKCAAGNLLMLAPLAWPYLPGEKRMTRADAQVLNRIAQQLCGDGAVAINYRGRLAADVETLVAQAVNAP